MSHPKHPTPFQLFLTFVGLMILLGATVLFAQFHLGSWNTWLGLAIAVAKTLLIVVLFMNLIHATNVMRLVAGSAMVWLSFAMVYVLADYHTRGWDETEEHGLLRGDHIQSVDQVDFVPSDRQERAAEPK